MIEATLVDAITYSSLLAIMSFGLTLVRITTNVWNVAHAAAVTVGAYVIYTCVSFMGGSPYLYLPFAFVICAFISVGLYLLVVEPLRKRGASSTMILVATIAADLVFLSIINIFADYLQKVFKLPSKNFLLRNLDFTMFGLPGIGWASLLFLIGLLILLNIMLKYTKIGLALRACVSNASLASISGINVKYVYTISWLLAGGLAGVAGGLLTLWIQGNPVLGDSLVATMFCVSILGGLKEIYGTVFGAYLTGFAQILTTTALSQVLGVWVIPYKALIPMVILVLALLFVPEGITGTNWRRVLQKFRTGGWLKRKA
jgi:branched-chain amino acid transport system permease protein